MDAPNISVALAFIAGLLSFLSPCVLPLAPAYVGYLGGTALVTAEGVMVSDRRTTLIHAASFILGFSAVFVALGASVGLIGYLLYDFMPLIQKVGGVLLVIFGLHYTCAGAGMGVFKIPFLYQQKRIEFQADPRLGYFSSLLVGVFFGAGWLRTGRWPLSTTSPSPRVSWSEKWASVACSILCSGASRWGMTLRRWSACAQTCSAA